MLKKLKKNKKGFTLAELLIVVAIIGVLVAISIPIFTSQLEKSRDAVSVANMRAAYAEAQTLELTATKDNDTADKATYKKNTDGSSTVTVSGVAFKGKKADDNFSGLADDLPFASYVKKNEPAEGNHDMEFSYDGDGQITGVTIKP